MGRRWKQWPRRFKEEIDASSGLVGFGGTVVAGAGIFLASPLTIGAGAVLASGSALWCAVRSFPEKAIKAQDLAGSPIFDLEKLDLVDPPIRKLGLIGASRVGKTTLLSHLTAQPTQNIRTEEPSATILFVQGTAPAPYALIDAAGQQYSQQFKVVDESDSLIVFFDHSESETSMDASDARLLVHQQFFEQLQGHIKQTSRHPKRVHFLLNKRDIWENGPDSARLKEWFSKRVEEWKLATSARVTMTPHSNRNSDDISKLAGLLREWATRSE